MNSRLNNAALYVSVLHPLLLLLTSCQEALHQACSLMMHLQVQTPGSSTRRVTAKCMTDTTPIAEGSFILD